MIQLSSSDIYTINNQDLLREFIFIQNSSKQEFKVLKTRSMKQYTERWIYLSIYTLFIYLYKYTVYIYKNIAQVIIIINQKSKIISK